ncbi:hypothetical protein TUN199_08208 [Pyrenophora tritici-repentis]|uniref:Uncharacterized protein n=1 Tax=Pyrenophora tritici-repentis (strain Pt-1C-BFP) TaxID=426418 RepID=B2VSR7_PYRTR|nr:uncharacterized protein PTRG_01823 [Pyrenophora tritici-repentis Pt-1C-BFP]KAI0569170.1 hypothetical protein Alg215_11791 [Pyrenophora tritici-repentis]EDU41261.1 predicted protein [Pyrenophora tritici-repentis Pt-1C-BFP]KAI0582428.1 hypothetical protein Alg130_06168 [Pyrenophora tritici-repentis]KAI0607608.1 hypothetical protein TUN205_08155 [Pyrenophora tritici-repentis]KAI0619810.1 hypothetical protein TUN199_08208 [Pyrenophora tritici-repentis]
MRFSLLAPLLVLLLGEGSLAKEEYTAAVIPGTGCICMVRLSQKQRVAWHEVKKPQSQAPNGRSTEIHERTETCCKVKKGLMRGTVDFWGRTKNYCHFEDFFSPQDWDQDCCRRIFHNDESGISSGYCNAATI